MKSIKLKIWFSILGLTLLVILLIWISQVFLLEKIYLQQKENELHSDCIDIFQLIEYSGVDDTVEELTSLVSDKNYSIEIVHIPTMKSLAIQPEGSKNLFLGSENQKKKIIAELSKRPTGEIITDKLNIGGRDVYIMSTLIFAESPYLIMIGSTLAPVVEAVSTIQNQLIFISIFLIIFASIISFIIARSLTRPITKLSNAVQQIANGHLDTVVDIKSHDELGRLGNDFNRMAREISKANDLQRELVANVSHDIRTPLTMIKGYAETIKDLTGDNKQKREEQLDIIVEESNRLNVLVNDILDLSKLQAKQLVLNYNEFDLAQKIRDILKRYELLISNENYNFTLIAPEKVIVFADEVKIEQVLYNIINNATNHTGEDKKITIVLEDKQDVALVKIIDTGKGIEPEFIHLIWNRYYKPYKKNDRKGMGTGLGLSIVKAILETHGFNFGVESTLNVGSNFWFEVKKSK